MIRTKAKYRRAQDPKPDPAPPSVDLPPDFTICHDCKAKLPNTEFNVAKYSPTGRSYICRHCRSQYLRFSRMAKRSSTPRHNEQDLVIRSVLGQNLSILHQALPDNTLTCTAFVPHTNLRYKVHFGRSRYDFPSMAIFNVDGSSYLEVAFSGIPKEKLTDTLIDVLKNHQLRLELSDEHIELSNKLIYFY